MTNSLEDYLETIYLLVCEHGYARVKDVALAMQVKMPSVNKAVQELKKRDYVTQEPYGAVNLTVAGQCAASEILSRHRLIREFLLKLGVSEEYAERDACLMEHILSKETLACMAEYVK